jgi:hypothetical protein
MGHFRHAGLDPASTFLPPALAEEKGGPRIKSGVTKSGGGVNRFLKVEPPHFRENSQP